MMDLFKKYDLNIFLNPKNLFLKNTGLKQTIFKNTFWLAVASGASKFLRFFLFIYIARILGAAEYGKFSFALAFIGLFAIFSDLGIFKILTREFSKDKEKEKDFPALISLKILLSLFTLVLIFIGSFFITDDSLIRMIILILAVEVLLLNFLNFFYAFFRARQKMEYQSWAEIIQATLVTLFGLFVLFNVPSIQNLSWAYLSATLFALIFVCIFFYFRIFPLKLVFDKLIWMKYLKMAYPLGLAVFVGTISFNLDSILLGYSGQISQIGWYAAGQRIASAAFIPFGFISMSFFPVLGASFRNNLQRVFNSYLQSVIFLAIPLTVGGVVLAEKIIDFVYGPSYFPSVLAFQILLVSSCLASLGAPFSHYLIISERQKKVFLAALFGTILNVMLNLILIPKYSLYGASLASLGTSLLISLFYFGFALRCVGIKPVNLKIISTLLIALFSSFLMSAVISSFPVYNLYIIWKILIGFSVYLFCFSFLKFLGNILLTK